jgi:hypothetical protein
MQTHTGIAHRFDGDVEVSLCGSSLSVTDSKSRDSVSITGTNPLTMLKACQWFITFYACPHNDEAAQKQRTLKALVKVKRETQSQIDKLTEELGEKAAEALA